MCSSDLKQGGLQRPDLDAPLLNRPEQERDSRADRLHPGPGGLDVAAMPVVIPEMDVGAALSQAAVVFHEPSLVAVAYDQFVHETGVEVRVVGQVERRFVQGNEALDIGLQRPGAQGHHAGIQEGGGDNGG